MRLPTGRYRTPLSRASLAENVSRLCEKFGNLSDEAGVETWPPSPLGFQETRHTGSPYPSVVFKVWWLGNVHRVHELWCGVGGKQAKRYELINGLDG